MKNVALVGASGVVGKEFIELFKNDKNFDGFKLLKFARTARPEQDIKALEESWGIIGTCSYVVNATSSEVAKKIASKLKDSQVLIDNTSAFRMDENTPLVVPEINADLISSDSKVIANPNCTAIILCVALNSIMKFGVEEVHVSTYQAASGAGIEGLNELQDQYKKFPDQEGDCPVFGYPLVNNVISHNSEIINEGEWALGYNGEEEKVLSETKKILNQPDLLISVSCMRVPVERAHLETVTVKFKNKVNLDEINDSLSKAEGVKIVNDLEANKFPMPIEAQNQTDVLVGRMRLVPGSDRHLQFMCAGDQLLKGAAYNAFQILQKLAL